MKYQDPLRTVCPTCGIEARHSVRSLLELQARCTGCGTVLEAPGREIKEQQVQWFTFVTKVETAMLLEKRFGVSINDTELDAAKTGMDLVELIRAKLPLPTSDTNIAPESVRATIAATLRREISLEQLHMPLDKLLADLPREG